MAKKELEEDLDLVDEDDDDEDEDDDGSTGKKRGCLIMFIISSIIIITLVAILGFNAGGIRDKYLRSTLEKIPIVKNLLPPLKEPEIEENKISPEEETINSLTSEIEKLNEEIKRLKEFEANQLQFKAQKEEFDRMIALNDAKAYATFFEGIEPENAEKLYKEAVQKVELDKEFKNYISTFENMKKDAASKILEELVTTDTDLVVTILKNLSGTKRSEILSAMDSKNAAAISKLLYPKK